MAAFLLDHNVSARLATLLRAQGHTATTARELAMDTAGDERILLLAAIRVWTVITHNVKDFRLLHDAWRVWSRRWGIEPMHAGILIIPDSHQWSPEQATSEIETFIAHRFILTNALYEWKSRVGWQRRPLPPENMDADAAGGVTRDDVIAAVQQSSANEEAAAIVLATLDQYGFNEPERERVQLAMLRMSHNDLDQLRSLVAIAIRDYRDLLLMEERQFPEP